MQRFAMAFRQLEIELDAQKKGRERPDGTDRPSPVPGPFFKPAWNWRRF
jgi:hypothetical protein